MLLEPKYLPKLAATVGLFTRYGLADFAKQQGLKGIAPEPDSSDGDGAPSAEKAAAFRKRLVELGPAYVKLGQVLSTRPDLLPQTYIEELEKLQDDVGPIPTEDVRATIEEELGARISKLFEEFDDEPIGTASLGQVHAARLRDGRDVVVKVQRPDIRAQLAGDIEYFRELAGFLTAHTEAGERIDMLGIIQQLERALADELDYRVEARNAASFRRALAEFPRILIPRVIEGYTTEKVLTTERIRGAKISEISPLTRIEHDFHPVADELTRAYLKQITIEGHFHADPHPGNVFVVLAESENPLTPSEAKANDRRSVPRPAVTPLARMEAQAQQSAAPEPPDIDVRLSLIDFGMTARVSSALRDQIIRLLMDLSDNRGDDAAATLVEIGDELPEFDRATYVRDIASLMARNYDLAVGEIQAGSVLYELINISYQRRLRLPAELTLLAKALFNLDAVTRSLDPSYSPIGTIREYGNQIAADKARRELNPRKLLQIAMQGGDLLSALPHRLDLITQRVASGDFETRINVPQLTVLLNGLQKVANRIFSGLVLAAIIIASAMLITTRKTLGTWGFIVAGAVSAWMVISIWWGDRKKRGD
ncbi:MAG TPA: AarF/UbiB family protein [Gemmatimonadaceae bacterium]|nr:AarF/UbiB family protein [Gemmatimonadaceae bacterium]